MSANGQGVFIQTVDFPNFDRTVLNPVDTNEWPDAPAALHRADDGEGVRFWGVRTGSNNEDNYAKLQPDDLVLFYNEGHYIGTARVDELFIDHDEWVSETLWGNAPSYNIYTLRNFTQTQVHKDAINRLFGYKSGFSPRGFMPVADKNITNAVPVIKRAVERYDTKH